MSLLWQNKCFDKIALAKVVAGVKPLPLCIPLPPTFGCGGVCSREPAIAEYYYIKHWCRKS